MLVSKEARVSYGESLETDIKKPALLKEASDGKIKILIGTHALIEKGWRLRISDWWLSTNNIVLESNSAPLFLDTQDLYHIFINVGHYPRTIMMTMFGDLDLSIISELPKGRKEIITKIVDPRIVIKPTLLLGDRSGAADKFLWSA